MQTSVNAASPVPLDLSRIAQDLQIRKVHVEHVLQMLDAGMTIPYMARYCKERTGGLSEDVIRRIQYRIGLLRQLGERKQMILKTIENQGKLSDDLRNAILAAESPKRLEDLYLPFKPKKRTQASEAREKGLEPLAQAIWTKDPVAANLPDVLQGMVNPEKGLNTADDVLAGVKTVLAEIIAEQADLRGAMRMVIWETGKIVSSRSETLPENKGQEFKGYFDFNESIQQIPPHRILAINRGEKEEALKVRIEYDVERIRKAATAAVPLDEHPHKELLQSVLEDAVGRIVLPNLEREVRRELTDFAQGHAVSIFGRNLRSLLLQRPLRGQRIVAIDPGLRAGCRIAVIDEAGQLLDHSLIHPNQPFNRKQEAKIKLEELIRKYQLTVVAIGNGTGCRDTEKLVAELIADLEAGKSAQMPQLPTETPVAASDTSIAPAAETAESTNSSIEAPLATPAVDASAPIEPPSNVTESDPPRNADAPHAETTQITNESASAETAAAIESPDAPSTMAAPAAASPPLPPSPPKIPEPPPHPPIDLSVLPAAPKDISYVIVNEAGASDYAASQIGREEFPEFDNSLRSTISIGRRLQDPLRELVKIDPQHVGVGLYQHDVRPRQLRESLQSVVESCVNFVGADLNTAGVSLLRFISGLNPLVAREIVDHRAQHGPFRSREQLKQIPSINDKRFEQAAGFLRVHGGDEPLDGTWIHPESYPVAQAILNDVGMQSSDLRDAEKLEELRGKLKTVHPEVYAAKTGMSISVIKDVFHLLANPRHDPRDDQPMPIFRKSILKIEDLKPGQELRGTVLNVVDFGAFVDIGLKDSGLVHISQMANRYIKNPYELLAVGDVVTVWVRSVDVERRHVSLSMIAPGSERKPAERRHGPPRGERREPIPTQGEPPPKSQGPPHEQDRGQRRGRPPRREFRRPGAPAQPQSATSAETASAAASTAAPPPRPHRPPGKPKPLPKLSASALKGKTPLHSFGELEAFFKAKEEPPPQPEPPASAGDQSPPQN